MNGDDTDRQDDSALRTTVGRRREAWVRVFGGAPDGAGFRAGAGGTTIGRSAEPAQADILLDDGRASRLHARIAFDGDAWGITDAGSRNGGFVDGAVLAPGKTLPLVEGSVIRLGDSVAVFHLDPCAAPGGDAGFFPGISTQALEGAAARPVQVVIGDPDYSQTKRQEGDYEITTTTTSSESFGPFWTFSFRVQLGEVRGGRIVRRLVRYAATTSVTEAGYSDALAVAAAEVVDAVASEWMVVGDDEVVTDGL